MLWPIALLRRLETRSGLRALLLLVAGTALASLLEVVAIGLVFPVIAVAADATAIEKSRVLSAVYREFGFTSQQGFIAGLAGTVALLFLVKAAFLSWFYWVQARFVTNSARRLSVRLYRGYLNLPLTIVRQRSTTDLAYPLASMSFGSWTSFLLALVGIAAEAVVAVGLAAMLIALQPLSTLTAALGVGILLLVQSRIVHPIYARLGAEALDFSKEHLKMLLESFRAHSEIKISGSASYFLQLQARIHRRVCSSSIRLLLTTRIQPLVTEAFFLISALGAVLVTIFSAANTAETLAGLAVLVAAAFRFLPILNRLQSNSNQMHNARAAVETLAQEVASLPTEEADEARIPLVSTIALRDVTLTYPDSPSPVLDRVDLAIRRGESVGLVGRSGSGKTTIGNLLLGLLAPSAGEVVVDGRSIAGHFGGWRKSVAAVPQETIILDDTVARNVAFGVPDAEIDRTRVRAALEGARLADLDLDAALGENGARLSGGQKQRIGIARALYRDVDLLILDEPTSALDSGTEQELLVTLEQLRGRTTLVLIAHRESTLAICDRVVVVNDRGVHEGRDRRMGSTAREHAAVNER